MNTSWVDVKKFKNREYLVRKNLLSYKAHSARPYYAYKLHTTTQSVGQRVSECFL